MKKLVLCACVLMLLFVSCNPSAGDCITLELEHEGVGYEYKGELLEDKVYDVVTLHASGTDLRLNESCLGDFKGHAKKVIVSDCFKYISDDAFCEDSVLECLVIENASADVGCCCYGCTNLTSLVIGTSEVDDLTPYTTD